MKGKFGHSNVDKFSPEYGGIQWKHRLNNWLENMGVQVQPVAYSEEQKPAMQLTQENTMIFWNMFADEMDAIALTYTPDGGDTTWYFREQLSGITVPCLLYTSPSPRDGLLSRMPSSA